LVAERITRDIVLVTLLPPPPADTAAGAASHRPEATSSHTLQSSAVAGGRATAEAPAWSCDVGGDDWRLKRKLDLMDLDSSRQALPSDDMVVDVPRTARVTTRFLMALDSWRQALPSDDMVLDGVGQLEADLAQ